MMHEKKFFTTNLDVRFRDLDVMGHVNNAVFFTYFEQGRLDFFNSASPDVKFPGFDFILAHINCDYLKPVTIDDHLTLQIQIGKIGRKSFNFNYAIVDRADAKSIYATGASVQVCFDYQQNKTVQVSGELKDLLHQYLV